MKKIIFISTALFAFFFTSCKKELSDDFNLYTGNPLNDTVWVRNVSGSASVNELIGLLSPTIVIDSFEVSRDTTLSYGDSLEVFISGSSLIGTGTGGGPAGSIAPGKVRLEIIRLKTKGDFIKLYKPTTANNYLLETGGAFFIRISRDGKELALAPGKTIRIRFSDTEAVKNNMQLFNGAETTPFPPFPFNYIDTNFTWVRDADTSYLKTFQKTVTTQSQTTVINGYEIVSGNLRWLSAERYVDSTRQKTKITAILPPNFTNKNTAVFAVFTDQKTIVNLKADFASRSFAAINIPLLSKIKVISISRIGGDLYLGTKDVNDVGSVTAYQVKPDRASLKDILLFLNSL